MKDNGDFPLDDRNRTDGPEPLERIEVLVDTYSSCSAMPYDVLERLGISSRFRRRFCQICVFGERWLG
ncbi:MAG: hypothetical protein ACUVTP_12640 [Candidatus Fervidibacter sp.]|uniref:hypothetical protein n=1 Tax=Candidatus Fervidibacter sp. TaxID=3100871 RepID=UPI00404A31A7